MKNWRVRETNSSRCLLASLVQSVATRVQNHLAVPDFAAGDTVLIGVLDHVTSQ